MPPNITVRKDTLIVCSFCKWLRKSDKMLDLCSPVYGPDRNFTEFWNSSVLQFDPCFEKTWLVWIPCALFLAQLPFAIPWGKRSRPEQTGFCTFCAIRLVFVIVAFAICMCRLVVIPIQESRSFGFDTGELIGLILITLFWLVLSILTYLSMRFNRRITGTLQFWTSLIFLICALPEFYDKIHALVIGYTPNVFDTVTFILFVASLISILVIFSINHYHFGENTNADTEWPEKRASAFSRLFFCCYWKVIYKGYKGVLTLSDLWQLNDTEQTANVTAKLEPWLKWSKQKIKSWHAMSLVIALICSNWRLILSTLFLVIIREAMALIIVWDIKWMLIYVTEQQPVWHGVFYIIIVTGALFIRGLCFAHKDFQMVKLSLRIRSGLCAQIVKKSLALSPESRKIYSPGEVHNYSTIDTGRLLEHLFVLHLPFSLPIQMFIGAYLLYSLVGHAFWAGILTYIVCGFISLSAYQLYFHYFNQKCELRDKRMRVLVETLANIKLVKYYAWEEAFKEFILKVRRKENIKLRNALISGAPGDILLICTMQLACISLFSIYTLLKGHVLTGQTIFLVAAIFRFSLCDYASINEAILLLMKSRTSFIRLGNFFAAEEMIDYVEKYPKEKSESSIAISNGNFSWSIPATFSLENLNMDVPRHQLVGIAGVIGSGKSSLIGAIAGEMNLNAGSVKIYGSCAYVPQQAWILNDTLKGNILFGRPYNEDLYKRVLAACALLPDLAILPAGDRTEIGERGVNLSGGQKQRISLARAMYQNCDIYLLDDPLSAVDVHVREHLFEHVIGPNGMLKEKTRLLVTNAISYLPKCDRVILMENGRLIADGSYEEAAKHSDMLSTIETHDEKQRKASEIEEEPPPENDHKPRLEKETAVLKRAENSNVGKLIEKETVEYGKVSKGAYWLYMRAGGIAMLLSAILIIGAYSLDAGAFVWLHRWTNSNELGDGTISNRQGILILGAFVLSQLTVAICFSITSITFAMRTIRILHDAMLMKILRAPITFFDSTPIGRILNRFGKEIQTVDLVLYARIILFMHSAASSMVSLGPSLAATPILAAFVFPALIGFVFIERFYIVSARQFQRIEAVHRSPIYSHVHDVLHGPGNIRIYGRVKDFINRFSDLLDNNVRAQMMLSSSQQWLTMNLIVVYEIIVAVAISLSLMSSSVAPGSVGLSIAFIIGFTDTVMVGIRRITGVETHMVAVERIQQYLQIPSEAEWKRNDRRESVGSVKSRRSSRGSLMAKARVSPGSPKKDQPLSPQFEKSWPSVGRVEFVKYALKYRPELPFALQDFNLVIEGGEKVGVVGRTGAGKTSITIGLFRLIEPSRGKILIDGVDITTLGLHELRREMTVIPQDPSLFYGTLRQNIDPFEEYSDDQIWTALEHSHLKNYIKTLQSGLDSKVEDGGANISVGQRQLVCLARALLRKSKILVLDEATACVDVETDKLIQTTIQTEFSHCTVITIAHRLETVLDYDKAAVLDKGRCVEYGAINDLLSNKSGQFYDMVSKAGLLRKNRG